MCAVRSQLPFVGTAIWCQHACPTGAPLLTGYAFVVLALARSAQLPPDRQRGPVAAPRRPDGHLVSARFIHGCCIVCWLRSLDVFTCLLSRSYHRTVTGVRWRSHVDNICILSPIPPDRLRGSRRTSQASGPPCGVGALLPWVRAALPAGCAVLVLAPARSTQLPPDSQRVRLQLPCVRTAFLCHLPSSTGAAVPAGRALAVLALARFPQVTGGRLQLPSVLTPICRKLGSFRGAPVPSGCAVVVLARYRSAELPPDPGGTQ